MLRLLEVIRRVDDKPKRLLALAFIVKRCGLEELLTERTATALKGLKNLFTKWTRARLIPGLSF
jgi:hypothetical protein